MNLDDVADYLRNDPEVHRITGGRIYVARPQSSDIDALRERAESAVSAALYDWDVDKDAAYAIMEALRAAFGP